MAATYYAVVQYAGSGFAGWQRQTADRTVQEEIESVLEKLEGRRVVIHAAGRTDAGVHALAQVTSFGLQRDWELEDLARAVRALLPPDIWVARLGRAPSGFHARKDATARRYRYVLGWDDGARSPFRRPFEWAVPEPLDRDLLSQSAKVFLGRHDFRAYAAAGQSKPHYDCTILQARWDARDEADGCIFTIEADRFLHRMVRFLVGTMVDVGSGRRQVSDVQRLLTRRTNNDTSPPAPPHGLYLVGVRYPQLDEGYVR